MNCVCCICSKLEKIEPAPFFIEVYDPEHNQLRTFRFCKEHMQGVYDMIAGHVFYEPFKERV